MSVSTQYSHHWLNFIIKNLKYIRWFLLPLFLIFICLSSAQVHAVCEVSGSQTGRYVYNSSNVTTDASVTMSGSITCYNSFLGLGIITAPYSQGRICVMASFNGVASTSDGKNLPFIVYGTVGGGGDQNSMNENQWYGPAVTARSNNTINYNISLMVPGQAGGILASPVGTYTAFATIYWDMQASSRNCERRTASDYGANADSGNMQLTASYVVPKFCQLNSTSNVNFGTMPSIGTVGQVYDATGAISTTCNSGTSYSIALGLGSHYDSNLAMRRMYNTNSKEYIAYGLYSDAARTRQWNMNQDISLTGTGSAQNSMVYGRVPNIARTAVSPGIYSDSVIVTVTY